METQFPASWVLVRMLTEDNESPFFDTEDTEDVTETAVDMVNEGLIDEKEALMRVHRENAFVPDAIEPLVGGPCGFLQRKLRLDEKGRRHSDAAP